MECKHKTVTFWGQFSMVGNYICDDCGVKINPVDRAKQKGELNVELLDYYTKNPSKLNVEWRDHPWVRHLYKTKNQKFIKN